MNIHSTTDYLKKLKLLLHKSQSQLKVLANNYRATQAAAAGGGGGAGGPPVLPALPPKLEAATGGEMTKYYVDVDPDSAGPRGPYQPGEGVMQAIQRPPIAPGT